MTNGVFSYNGTYSPSCDRHIPFFEMADGKYWPQHRHLALESFVDMRNTFHASAVRLLITIEDPSNGDSGVDFPYPNANDLAAWREILDTAKLAGLKVILVVLPPQRYRLQDPEAVDLLGCDPTNPIYAPVNNGLCPETIPVAPCFKGDGAVLKDNMATWMDEFFIPVLGPGSVDPWGEPRVNNVQFVSVLGDFAPFCYNGSHRANERLWWKFLWSYFNANYSFIPTEKKTFEQFFTGDNPINNVHWSMDYVNDELNADPNDDLIVPEFFSVSVFPCNGWLDAESLPLGGQRWKAVELLFQTIAGYAGGIEHVLVEQFGVQTCPTSCQYGPNGLEDIYNDFLFALHAMRPQMPVAIWVYREGAPSPQFPTCTDDGFGVYEYDGDKKTGWWLLPWHFGRCEAPADLSNFTPACGAASVNIAGSYQARRSTLCANLAASGGTLTSTTAASRTLASAAMSAWLNGCSGATVPADAHLSRSEDAGASTLEFAQTTASTVPALGSTEVTCANNHVGVGSVPITQLAITRHDVMDAECCGTNCPPPTACTPEYRIVSTGSALATGSHSFSLSTGTFSGSSSISVNRGPEPGNSTAIVRRGFISKLNSTTTASAIWRVGSLVRTPTDFTCTGDECAASVPLNGSAGSHTLTTALFEFTDATWNVADSAADSGRFNINDINEIVSDSSNPAYLAMLDFDDSGVVDSDELAVLTQLVNVGLDSGVFGDIDQLGGLDCSGLSGSYTAYFGATLDQSNYRITLDHDLDGDVDATDWHNFIGRSLADNPAPCLRRGDLNCDGVVTVGDIGPFVNAVTDLPTYQTAYPYCDALRGDMNADGVLSTGDISLFLACVQNGCP